MKINLERLFFCLLMPVIVWTAGGLPLAAETKKVPRIVFEGDSHNFGDVYKGEKVSHRFRFTNAGTDDLVIENVKTSCGCTAAAPSGKTIAPGTQAEIEVTFKSNAFRGYVSKTVTVNSNDPETPRQVLTIKANVVEEVVAEPQRVFFEPVKRGQSVTKKVEIKALAGLELKIQKARVAGPVLKLHYKKKGKENAYVLEVSTKKDAPVGRFAGDIQVFTNSERQRVLVVPFFGEIISDVSVFPVKVSYGVVQKGKGATRQILITIHKKDVRLEKFYIEPDYLDLELTPDYGKYFHRLLITLSKDVPVGKIKGSLKIHTTSKDQPLLTIPIYGVVKEG